MLLSNKDKLVLLLSATFKDKKGYNTHRLLRAIDNNTLLSKLPKNQVASENDKFLSVAELIESCKEYPYLISNTKKILENWVNS